MLRKLLGEPLLHFLLLATLLFLIFSLRNPGADDERSITVSEARVQQIQDRFAMQWQRQPTPKELENLIRAYVLEEAYAREARAMGLQEGDTVIRRRLQQKLEFMVQGMSTAANPDDAVLQTWFDSRRQDYRAPDRYSFFQVYISTDRPEQAIAARVEEIEQQLASGVTPAGDTTSLPADLDLASSLQISRNFGQQFVEVLEQLAPGQWQGPVQSGLGLHFVFLRERERGEVPDFAQAREKVLNDWRSEQNRINKARYDEILLEKYPVQVEGEPLADE